MKQQSSIRLVNADRGLPAAEKLGPVGVEVEDPVRFHMTINLSRFSGAEVVQMVLQARLIHELSP